MLSDDEPGVGRTNIGLSPVSARSSKPLCLSRVTALLLASVSILTSGPLRAAELPPLEYQVKAAFLLNFTKFVEWPASAFVDEHSPFAICILGENPFGITLTQMVRGESVNGRRLIVRTIQRPPEPKACQVLFIAGQGSDSAKTIAVAGTGVLTVGEDDNFLNEGGVIAFVIENRRVRFDINQKAAGNALLTLSSGLLNVARSVKK